MFQVRSLTNCALFPSVGKDVCLKICPLAQEKLRAVLKKPTAFLTREFCQIQAIIKKAGDFATEETVKTLIFPLAKLLSNSA